MKVRELIELLSKFDPELDVVYNYHCPEDGNITVEIDGANLCNMYRVQWSSTMGKSFQLRKPHSKPYSLTECAVVALND